MKTRTTKSLLQLTLAIAAVMTIFAVQIFAQHGNSAVKTDSKILYHDGPVMQGSSNVYLIWYGNWNTVNDSFTKTIITELALNLGSSSYFQINADYPDSGGISPNGGLIWSGTVDDLYSQGLELTAANIQAIVADKFDTFRLPVDSNGVYLVLGLRDISSNATGFCQPNRPPHHGMFTYNGTQVKYAFIGDSRRCPTIAAPHLQFPGPTPNDNFAGDGMANTMAAVLSAMVTNPTGTGWFDRYGFENSTKCQGIFGPTYQAANGSLANIRLGMRDFLLQQNWVNARKGYCALVTPTPQ